MPLLLGASCVRIKLRSNEGGVYVSADTGAHWQQAVDTLSTDRSSPTLASFAIADLVMDPQDTQTLYALFGRSGFAVTNNGGLSWRIVESLPKREIRALAVSPRQVCTVYVATVGAIMRSEDCLRSWQTLYIDPREEARVLSLAIPATRPQTLYATLATGELLESQDGGGTWSAAARFRSQAQQILVDPGENNRLYVVTRSHGIFLSRDRGKNWTEFNDNITRFGRVQRIFDLRADQPGVGLLALTEFGLYRSRLDQGPWESIRIIPSPGSVPITAVAADPADARKLFYTARGTLYVSTDSGMRWRSQKLPTERPVSRIIIDPRQTNRMFFATMK